ncbi:hypothetical protein ABBQ38_009675 [Trebouxia sp. C0009 RCD-2024]
MLSICPCAWRLSTKPHRRCAHTTLSVRLAWLLSFCRNLEKVWGPVTLFKPSGKVFTIRTQEPYPSGSYLYTPATSAGNAALWLAGQKLIIGRPGVLKLGLGVDAKTGRLCNVKRKMRK